MAVTFIMSSIVRWDAPRSSTRRKITRLSTVTHVRGWHAHHHTEGTGPTYQGRFKSFPVQEDDHYFRVCRYVERNALRANLVRRAENWRWSSLWQRYHETGVPWQIGTGKRRSDRPGGPVNGEQRPDRMLARGHLVAGPDARYIRESECHVALFDSVTFPRKPEETRQKGE
jgi:hypothetical protein